MIFYHYFVVNLSSQNQTLKGFLQNIFSDYMKNIKSYIPPMFSPLFGDSQCHRSALTGDANTETLVKGTNFSLNANKHKAWTQY